MSAVAAALLGFLAQALHTVLMVASAPLVVGLVRVVRSRLLGRRGASPLQPWRDLRRLMRKQRVVAEEASPLFLLAPVAAFAANLAAVALVPSFARGMATAPVADLLLIGSLLALARCVLALAAMDGGTSFGGIGASRLTFFAVFAEPALLLVFFALALLAGSTNLDEIVGALREGSLGLRVSLGFAAIAAIGIGLTASGRLPFEDPASRNELTMVHEALLLEYGGRDLALMELAGALRLLLWLTLIAAIFFPFGIADADTGPLAWLLGLASWGGKVLVLGIGLALLETASARMRIVRVPQFLAVALLFGVLAALLLFAGQGPA